MFSPLASSYSSSPSFITLEITWLNVCLKNSEKKMSEYHLNQHELSVPEIMIIHNEEEVFSSIYPCPEFMRAAGIFQDFQTQISNAGWSILLEKNLTNM